MSALTIMLIRHAEKPDPDSPELGPGLTLKGEQNEHSLVVRGWQRGGAWGALFGTGMGGEDFPTPHVVYAADPDQTSSQDVSHSQRSFETVIPLCQRLFISPITKYGVGAESDLVKDVNQLTGVVMICWEHKRIAAAILPALANGQVLHLPTKWDRTRFDVVLRFDRAQSGALWNFRQLFPRLLAGDQDIPLSGEE